VSAPGPLLASAHAQLAQQLAAVPAGKRGAAIAVVETTGAATVGFATRLGDDWAIGGDVTIPLREPKALRGRIIVTGTW
jgi:uncharacterized membrane protein YgcG